MNKTNNYAVYLLDADDTLLNFTLGEKHALKNMLYDFDYEMSEELYNTFHRINRGLWKKLADGKIKKSKLLPERFRLFAAEAGLSLIPELANRSFLTHLSYQAIVLPGVESVLEQLSRHSKIIIATNGVSFVQKRRFVLSGLMPYINEILVSEAIGVGKPDPLFFEVALRLAGNPEKKDVLMVGDSVESDIRGANNYGLDSCLYDPQGLNPDSEATFTISKIEELLTL
ncbi:MAG TPA: noncanonical pyrimidine nucleotidase, YjjG family [Clostridiaceae bacterium]|nr:noncanonical pyrimidine nucleotidase, YjjG family [Clostridiaceae bacterium]